MREHPTRDEKGRYEDDGFLVVEKFLEPAELGDWREVVEDALARRGSQRFSFVPAGRDDPSVGGAVAAAEGTGARRGEESREETYRDTIFIQRVNLWQTSEAMRDLLFQASLGTFVGEVAGVEGLRIWHDQALVKEPYANPTSYHLDVPYWSFTSAHAITIWIALDDATLENGCLYYVPSSHRAQKFDNVAIGERIGALFDVYPEWRDVPAVPCPIPAGGALLHNGLTFHGAGANMTPGRRRAITCAYMPDGSKFNGQRNVLPPAYLASLRVGDLLDNEAQNPLVYRRDRPS